MIFYFRQRQIILKIVFNYSASGLGLFTLAYLTVSAFFNDDQNLNDHHTKIKTKAIKNYRDLLTELYHAFI